ncbi:hypothetical protein DFH09DRAFT_1331583 [Mycena vulgaris]|nr:hypothetical protein DFH09DRAFT_1331583 [Mycena vulgaris]
MRESDPKRLRHGKGTIRLPEEDTGDRATFCSTRMRAGFIDILTPYSTVKKLEHFWKGLSADRHKISPVEPGEYGNRFFEFMKAIMRGGGDGERFKAYTLHVLRL